MASVPGRPDLEVEPVAPMNSGSPTMVSPTGSLIATPLVSPEPAYIAAKEAAFIITREVLVEFHRVDEADFAQMQESSLSQISQSAVANVNAFLDRILLNILSNARSLSLVSLRPAVRDVLRPKLAQEAIHGADEELIECIGEDDDAALFEDAQESQEAHWDLDLAWKRARLRCMVYTRLGDMEEEDEDRYIDENGLDSYSAARRLSGSGSMVSPPVAIWLTAILEFIGENVLMVASHAAYRRCENKYGRGIAGQALHPSVVLVGDNDLEKIALSPVLGRLWRAWRKPIRSPKTSISRALSIDSMRHRRVDSRSSTGFTKRASSETLNSLRPEAGSQRGSLAKEQIPVVDPAAIAIPATDFDIAEIEIPWFNPAALNASRPSSLYSVEDDVGTAEMPTGKEDGEQTKAEKQPQQPGRLRSSSFPSTKWDLWEKIPKDISIPTEPEEEAPAEDEKVADGTTAEDGSNVQSEEMKPSSSRMSATLSGPGEFQAPSEVPAAEKRLSTISQRRRSKRLSQYSMSDRKSQVSEVSESGAPHLFSRSDYKLEQRNAAADGEKTLDAPPFASNVTAPTPVVDKTPVPPGSKAHGLGLAAPGKKYAQTSDDQSGYESGEVSPLEPSDDEGSVSITGLKDAQEHMSVPMQKGASSRRSHSDERAISPILEAQNDEAPVSPVSPEERGKPWTGAESADVSPVEQRRKPLAPQAADAMPQASASSTASRNRQVPLESAAVAAVSAGAMAAAASQAHSAMAASGSTINYPQQSRSSPTADRKASDERRREAFVISPSMKSPDTSQKEMPDIPKEAQVEKLAAAAAAHNSMSIPAPDDLYRSINERDSAGSTSRTSHDRNIVAPTSAPSTTYAPAAQTSKDISPSSQPRPPSKPRTVAPPVEPVITSVTPVPAPAPLGQPSNAPQMKKSPASQPSNAPQFRKPVSGQFSNAPQQKAPQVSSQSSNAPQNAVHRKEVSQDSRPSTGHGVTPLHLAGSSPSDPTPTSKLLERRRQLPQVDTVSPERAAVQRLSPSPTSASELNAQLPPRSIPEAVQNVSPPGRHKPSSRNQSKSGDEVLYAETHTGNVEKANQFNQLIDSGETIQYTLTPQNLRGAQVEKWQQETQPKPSSMDRNRSYSGSNNAPPTKQRSGSKTFAGIPVKIPWNAIRSDSRLGTATKSGMEARDAKTAPESLRELTDFMRSLGPSVPSSQPNGAPATSSKTGKRAPQPVRSQDISAKPATASMPFGARDPAGNSLRASSVNSNRQSTSRLVARDAQASSSGMSDLISFMNEESPRANASNSTRRGPSYGGSMSSAQDSYKTNSTNSHTGLMAGGRSSGRYRGGASEEPMMPVRKSRKPRDPYAIDEDDDDILEEEEGGGNEESLADFLNSQGRISNGTGGASHPPRISSTGASTNTPGNARGANAGKVSSIGRPIGPGGVPSRQSLLQARGASTGGGGSSTLELADFFKNSGPPAGTISRIPEEEPREKKGGIGKVFGGKRQKAT